jgi:hypothetical protein
MIKDSIALNRVLRGYVRVRNEAGVEVHSHNLVVYNGGDIIAKLLGGNEEYRISHMYFAYENTVGVPAPPAAARSDTAATTFHALAPPDDFLRAPVLDPPQYQAADANHLFNRVIFNAIASDTVGVLGLPFGAANNSKVYGVGLIAAPTGAYLGDLLYAYFVLPTALPAAGSGQISASWATEAN